MAEAEVEIRKWGNSLAVIVPADIVREEGLEVNDKAILRIMKVRQPARGSFGALKRWKIDPQKLKDELRRDHER